MANTPVKLPPPTMAAALAFLSHPAAGQEGGAQSNPILSAPTAKDLSANYPPRALLEDIGGDVLLACRMSRGSDGAGSLTDCDVASESPAGFGFGAAAIRISKKYRFDAASPAIASGEPIKLPVRFGLGAGDRPIALQAPGGPPPEKPAKLRADKYRSRAVLDCLLEPASDHLDCNVVSETPTGLGVGAYALQLGSWYRYSKSLEADRIGAHVRVTFDFNGSAPERPTPGAPQLCPARRDCAVAY